MQVVPSLARVVTTFLGAPHELVLEVKDAPGRPSQAGGYTQGQGPRVVPPARSLGYSLEHDGPDSVETREKRLHLQRPSKVIIFFVFTSRGNLTTHGHARMGKLRTH